MDIFIIWESFKETVIFLVVDSGKVHFSSFSFLLVLLAVLKIQLEKLGRLRTDQKTL